MGLKIVVLTDHSTHSVNNSIYGIIKAMFKNPEIEKVDLITRSDERNAAFFNGNEQQELFAYTATAEFEFPADRFFAEESYTTNLAQYDFMLLRLPRPVSREFFDRLVSIYPEKQIVNRPSGILKTGSKAFLLNFQKYTAPIQICKTIEEIEAFKNKFSIVLKPFEDYGGKGIVKIERDTVWLGNYGQISFSDFAKQFAMKPTEYLGMKYLRNVVNGDKRIVVANGKVLSSSLRLPGKGMWLCNVAQGGSASNTNPDERELEIIQNINPILKKEGIFLYGLDTLEEDDGTRVISEINTLSVGGITPAEELTGLPVTQYLVDEFIQYVKAL